MDLYRILGVGRDATPDEIKKAFREKAKKYHPDINPKHEELFKQITHAYDILIDPEKRKKYDRTLESLERKDFGKIFGDLLADFLGFHSKPIKGEDIKLKLKISVEEGFCGTVKEIIYKRKIRCPTCNGNGITKDSRIKECKKCKGKGRVKKAFIEIPCFECFGRGVIIINPCPLCNGSGRVLKQERKKIQIPAGVLDKQTVILEKGGNEGLNGGSSGDLLIKISIKNGRFKLKKLDLLSNVYINRKELKDAGYISITDIEGNILRVPVEHSDKPVKIRIKNKGYRNTSGKRGDLILKLIPV
ncbi:molecular chaperone DnaJ [Persephonella hydrogeniphila]|uniref:Molecular chaperone DnaJ n=1 Tax=Persephonella hydrogeniphila TaxID=198703 RepID=A0A285MZT2_9AQUI|nr:DnaJ domain-containing protein [Persephonella hydrogeniphila]SNZ02715.1 molecular chaperone DnaJ [Persephonella hydrogeniphila]